VTKVPTSQRRGDYAENWSHIKYLHLVYLAEHYIVFIDNDVDVDWETSLDYDKKGPKDGRKHLGILNEATSLEVTPCDGLRPDMRLQFKRLIGRAIACSLEHDYDGAQKMLRTAGTYISARCQETSRLWYLSSSFGTAAPVLLVGVTIWVWRDVVTRLVGTTALWLALAAVAGSAGALLSVIWRSGKLHFDASAGWKLHYLEGGSRICAGALSGVLVALAVQTEMILAPLTRGEKRVAFILIAAFAAGAGERLATSIISTVGAGPAKSLNTHEHSEAKDGTS
jgi:hypothetical protein